MPSHSTNWYHDPDVLVGELRRGGRVPSEMTHIDGFDKLQEVRRGGQGVVYSAIQLSTKRRVAVKVLLEGAFASASARRRFEREIDLVAGLRHPNIVNVYDSGTTSDGRLYFVMEYIDGSPLDRFVADTRSTQTKGKEIEGLLRLFVKVCDAVNYAHQRGVIHRDLKPGNVLVDAAGEPHVCDFGLAKTIKDSAVDDPALPSVSVTGQFMGSLPWASPEQLEGSSSRVDVRTDVYSLGVILYQALTGRFPYDVSGGIRRLFDNIARAELIRPSTIAGHLDDEIDTIVMKCLAREPQRRYQSALELADDIRHYLAGEPIQAKRDSAWYTLRKTLRRYQVAAFVTGVIMIAATTALGISLRFWRDATRARDEARQDSAERAAIGAFLERMLTSADPGRDGREVRFMDVLNKAAAELGVTLQSQPAVEAQVRRTLGATYSALGLFEPAETQLKTAYDLSVRMLGPRHRTSLELRATLPDILAMRGRMEEAEGQARSTLDEVRNTLGENDPLTLRVMARLGDILNLRGKTSEAEELLRASLDRQRRLLGQDHADTLATMSPLAVLLKQTGRYAEAEDLLRQVVKAELATVGPENTGHLTSLNNLALVLQSQGKLDQSEAMQRQTLLDRAKVLGEAHPDTVISMSNLATLLLERRKFDEAQKLLQRVVEIDTRVLGPDHPSTLTGKNNLAKAEQDMGRLDEAEKLFRETFDARRRVLGPEHAHTLLTAANLATVLASRRQIDQAVDLLRQVISVRQRTLGDDHFDTMVSKNNLGLVLQKNGRAGEAAGLFEDVCRSAAATLPADHYLTGLFRGNYGRCLMAVGRTPEAEEQLTKACQTLTVAFGLNDPRTQQNVKSLVELFELTGMQDMAASWRSKITTSQPIGAAIKSASARAAG